jgi:hypothetical protein
MGAVRDSPLVTRHLTSSAGCTPLAKDCWENLQAGTRRVMAKRDLKNTILRLYITGRIGPKSSGSFGGVPLSSIVQRSRMTSVTRSCDLVELPSLDESDEFRASSTSSLLPLSSTTTSD